MISGYLGSSYLADGFSTSFTPPENSVESASVHGSFESAGVHGGHGSASVHGNFEIRFEP